MMGKPGALPLVISRVSDAYRNRAVLNDVSLTIRPGQIFGLIGLNGAGKTTLMKSILGLRQPDQGDIAIFGDKAGSIAAKKHFFFLPERFDPPAFMTGKQFIRFCQSFYPVAISEQNLAEACERMAFIRADLDRPIAGYSKGMRQKVGLMAAYLSGSPLIMLDEPMSGLDPLARVRVKDLLMLAKNAGRTVFFSSHILADMDEMCDEVAVIHQTRCVYTGTPAGLRAAGGHASLERAFLSLIGAQTHEAA